MASNLSPWMYNMGGAQKPLLVRGKVQAASTQAIKMGELCTLNQTSGYWEPVDAAADVKWNLAFSAEEVSVLNTPQARYADFIVPRPDDVFEIEMAAATAITFESNYPPTGTDSQTATLDADGAAVLNSVGFGNYPTTEKYAGTTARSVSHGQFTVNPMYSYYKQLVHDGTTHMKVLAVTSDLTLLSDWSGMLVTNSGATGAVQVDLPQTCPIGVFFKFAVVTAQELRIHSAGGGVIVKGGKQADSKYVSITDEGDFVHVVCVGSNDWLAFSSISGADGDISVET